MTASRPLSVTFRVDASLDIGTGHVMRCLTLADALAAHGAECRFICREHPGHLIELIRSRGYPVYSLSVGASLLAKTEGQESNPRTSNATWLGSDWQTDARETATILDGLGEVDWLVVDHYALDARWEQLVRSHCGKVLAIDDLADRPHVCDVLLDQNLGREAGDYKALVPAHCRVLIGPRYALLRPEFAALREYSLQRRKEPRLKRLLIAMGGVDKDNATCKALETLKTCLLPTDCKITVVMGATAPWLEQVRPLAATMPWSTEVRVNISDMAKVMADSDLAIGAAGSTSWERCCLGLPALLVVLANNQWVGARALHDAGAALSLGEPAFLSTQLISAFRALLAGKFLAEMSLAARTITDGKGTARVVQHMECQA